MPLAVSGGLSRAVHRPHPGSSHQAHQAHQNRSGGHNFHLSLEMYAMPHPALIPGVPPDPGQMQDIYTRHASRLLP